MPVIIDFVSEFYFCKIVVHFVFSFEHDIKATQD